MNQLKEIRMLQAKQDEETKKLGAHFGTTNIEDVNLGFTSRTAPSSYIAPIPELNQARSLWSSYISESLNRNWPSISQNLSLSRFRIRIPSNVPVFLEQPDTEGSRFISTSSYFLLDFARQSKISVFGYQETILVVSGHRKKTASLLLFFYSTLYNSSTFLIRARKSAEFLFLVCEG
ncbi:hypothetical protein PGT21_019923 [Puccinia graminis f. sp. tritici]|uniref:Uncharacterized protein n=1 Tax=Puccinia graminis f. sp. tritici TaxID=56615 RepID=A0A5B0ML74_PUCGR|nr:hypothetical protein PGT21_019923 [Puccinia graminis f. sp. tritici]KAA1126978.1 hypothetical protein PGTUg99_034464 [Puccinia graminis f. sp. tritici]